MPFEPTDIVRLVKSELMPLWFRDRERFDRIDRWLRWEHDSPHSPRSQTTEHRELAARAQTPWGDLLVTALVQTLYIDGYRRAKAPTNSAAWTLWQANRMDGHQVTINRSVLGYGMAFGLSLPGVDPMTKLPRTKMRGVSPREMTALYEDPADDEWPVIAMRVARMRKAMTLHVYDDTFVHTLSLENGPGSTPTYLDGELLEHKAGVPPVVRFTDRIDLEGRVAGEIEPFISVLARVDQTTYDRLVVQRFASWVVRTISGMSITESAEAAGETPAQTKLRLRMEDFLTAEDPSTVFGSIPGTDLAPFIGAAQADIRQLAAVSQTPVHELLGEMSNLSADALAAARASQTAKSNECKHSLGESYEQWLRLSSWIAGDKASALDFESQVRWADTEVRSLGQAVDALGKMAQMLGLPLEMLWEKIPGFTDLDVERAKTMLANGAPTGPASEPTGDDDELVEPAVAAA